MRKDSKNLKCAAPNCPARWYQHWDLHPGIPMLKTVGSPVALVAEVPGGLGTVRTAADTTQRGRHGGRAQFPSPGTASSLPM